MTGDNKTSTATHDTDVAIEHDYKPPYLYWYESDFIIKTLDLTWLQRHLYRTLLQKQFFCETRPYLPADDNRLWKLADAENLQQWLDNKDAILEFFIEVEIEGQRLFYNKRLLEEWNRLVDKVSEFKDKQKHRSGLGVAKRRAMGIIPNPKGYNQHKKRESLPAGDQTEVTQSIAEQRV